MTLGVRLTQALLCVCALGGGVPLLEGGDTTRDAQSDPLSDCLALTDGELLSPYFSVVDPSEVAAEDSDPEYAPGYTWFRTNQAIQLFGHRFVKFGKPRRYDPDALLTSALVFRQVGMVSRVAVYASSEVSDPPGWVLIPLSPCVFAPYQLSYDNELRAAPRPERS